MISNRFRHFFIHDLKTHYSRTIKKLYKKNFFYEIEKCPICFSNNYKKISDTDRYGCYYPLVCCDQCSLLFSKLKIKEDKLSDYYSHFANIIKINNNTANKAFQSRTSMKSYSFDRFHWISTQSFARF